MRLGGLGASIVQLCISFPPPSYKELFEQCKDFKLQLPTLSELGSLIGLPVPIYATISQYSNELSQVIQYLQAQCTMANLIAMGKKLASVVGGELEKLLPKIPFLNISILALFSMDANAFREIIKEAYKTKKEELLNALKAFLPLPIYFDLSIPDFEINTIIKSVYTYCISMLIETVVSLIQPVLDILEIAGSLTLPKIPTLAEIQEALTQAVKNKVNAIKGAIDSEIEAIKDEYTAIKTAIKSYGLQLQSIFNSISFDGLPKIPFPSPFLPDFSSICYEVRECTLIYFNGILTAITDKIVSFVKSVLAILKIEFPRICINLPDTQG